MHGLLEIVVAVTPLLVVGGLLWGAQRSEVRRAQRVERQIALTDAIHRELGAVAAPEVTRGARGGWIVRIGVPLHHEALVASLTRIVREAFADAGRSGQPPLQVVLSHRDAPPYRALRPLAADTPSADMPWTERGVVDARRRHAA